MNIKKQIKKMGESVSIRYDIPEKKFVISNGSGKTSTNVSLKKALKQYRDISNKKMEKPTPPSTQMIREGEDPKKG